MTIELSEFWNRLIQAGVVEAAGCREVANRYRQAHQGAPPEDVALLVEFMVSAGELTDFQATALTADSAQEIKVGRHVIRAPQADPPFSRFVEVQNEVGRSGNQAEAIGSTAGLSKRSGILLRSGNDNPWLDKHVALQADSLQTYQAETWEDHVLVFSPIGEGHTLVDSRGRTPIYKVDALCRLGQAIASALAAMHDAGLVHGAVRADRIWVDTATKGMPSLLRDPSGPPDVAALIAQFNHSTSSSTEAESSSWLDRVDRVEHYLAPELAKLAVDSGLPPVDAIDARCDIYSLGCLLYRLRTGKPIFSSTSVQATLRKHIDELPPEIIDAVDQGEKGDPFYRVLAFALAKDPQARFQAAASLATALATVETMVQPAKREKPGNTKEPRKNDRGALPGEKKNENKVSRAMSEKIVSPPKEKKRRETPSHQSAASDPPSIVDTDVSNAASPPKSVRKKTKKVAPAEPPAVETDAPPPVIDAPAVETPAVQPPGLPPPPAAAEVPQVVTVTPIEPVQEQPEVTKEVRQRVRRKNRAPWVLSGLAMIVVMQTIYLSVVDPVQPVVRRKARPQSFPAVIPTVAARSQRPKDVDALANENRAVAKASPQGEATFDLVKDDRLLYAPPFSGDSQTIPLTMIPPGPAMLVSVHADAWNSSQERVSLAGQIAPEFLEWVEGFLGVPGIERENIKRISIAFHVSESGSLELTKTYTLAKSISLKDFARRNEISETRAPGGFKWFMGDDVDAEAFYFAALGLSEEDDVVSDPVTQIAVGPVAQIQEIAEIEGASIPLPRSLAHLWGSTDRNVDVAMMSHSNFLFSDGRDLLNQTVPQMVAPLRQWLIPDTSGWLVMVDSVADQSVYAELRLAESGSVSAVSLSRSLKQSLAGLSDWGQAFVSEAAISPSWRPLADRFPLMVNFALDRTRFGVSNQTATVNLYLPKSAVGQLSWATMLAMNTPLKKDLPASSGEAVAQVLSIDQMLDLPMSVSFDQESLEFALDAILEGFGQALPEGNEPMEVKMIGSDLQKDGITQNQQIRSFAKEKIPLRTILTDLVVAANPDKSAQGPADPRQALVWVVERPAEGAAGKARILVTTRNASQDRYELPREFRSDDPPK